MNAKVLQINISPGGLPKIAVLYALVGVLGINGDGHKHPKFHGGSRKALLLIASEVIDALKSEGWPLFYGALGENLTTLGLDHRSWRPGLRYRVGEVLIELTTPRQPCSSLNLYGKGIQNRIYDESVKALNHQSAHWGESGFYAAVLEGGSLHPDDIIQVTDPVT